MMRNLLRYITDTLHFPKFLSAEQVDVHVDTLLKRRYLRIDSTDIEERFDVTSAEYCRESSTKS